jgi:hypothetical protein
MRCVECHTLCTRLRCLSLNLADVPVKSPLMLMNGMPSGRRESVVLKDLKDCSVYLLDYSGEVEVTNVQDSQIFIGA